MPRENYYLLLELDLEEDDQSKITITINAKQQQWVSLLNHPSKRTWAKDNLAQIPEIRRKMADEDFRKKEAEEAKRESHALEKKRYEKLDKAIMMLTTKKYITEIEIVKLLKRKDFKSFARADVEKRISVPIKAIADQPEEEKIMPIDASTVKKIEADLALLKKDDLYDFLGMAGSSSVRTLDAKIGAKNRELRSKAVKDAHFTATQELLGQCSRLFKDEENKKRYDKTLAERRFKSLDELIDLAGLDHEIDTAEFEHLVREGANMGLLKGEIIVHVKQYAKRKKWSVQLPGEGSVLGQSIVCGVCNALNKPDANNCKKCGSPVKVECPGCETVNYSANVHCSKCGYSIADMPYALSLIRDAKSELLEGDYHKAEQLFKEAAIYWKDHPEVVVGLKKLKENTRQAENARAKVEEYIKKKHYYQARTALYSLNEWPDSLTKSQRLKSIITQKITGAERWLVKARSAKSAADKEEAYFEALQLCVDCQEAEDGIAATPALPPKVLNARVRDRSVLLSWESVRSKVPLSYQVIRKAGAIPAHTKDGELITQTAQLSYLDKSGMVGVSYYYAIFTLRNGEHSRRSTCSEPVIVIAEVNQLEAMPADGSVTLKWEASPHVHAFEVWVNKQTAPARRGEGTKLSTMRKNGAVHNGIVNGQQYGYLVIATYLDVFGKQLYTSGIAIHTAATTPPEAIEELALQKKGELIELTWEKSLDKVEIYRSENPFTFEVSEVLAYSHLSRIGEPVAVLQPNKTTLEPSWHGIQYFLPVTVKEQVAVVGNQAHFLSLEEVDRLKAKVEKEFIELTWTFPVGSQQVEVSYGGKLNTEEVQKTLVSRKEYDRHGKSFQIPLADIETPELLVRVKTISEGPEAARKYSDGESVKVKIKKTNIDFSLKKQGFRFRFSNKVSFKVEIRVVGHLNTPLELVVKEGNRLISYKDQDRTVLLTLSNKDLKASEIIQTTCDYQLQQKGVKNLFFSLIPLDRSAMNDLEIKDNGKRIKI